LDEREDPHGPTGEENIEAMDFRIAPPPAISPLFGKRAAATTPDQMAVADYYLGAANLRSPSDLYAELEALERLDRFGYRPRRKGAPVLVASPRVARLRRHVMDRVRQALFARFPRAEGTEN